MLLQYREGKGYKNIFRTPLDIAPGASRYEYRGPVKATPDDGRFAEVLALREGMWENCIFRRNREGEKKYFSAVGDNQSTKSSMFTSIRRCLCPNRECIEWMVFRFKCKGGPNNVYIDTFRSNKINKSAPSIF